MTNSLAQIGHSTGTCIEILLAIEAISGGSFVAEEKNGADFNRPGGVDKLQFPATACWQNPSEVQMAGIVDFLIENSTVIEDDTLFWGCNQIV